MALLHVVTMPQAGWDAVMLVLLEQLRTLDREGRTDLLAEMWSEIIPAIEPAVSSTIQYLLDDARPGRIHRAAG